MKAVHVLALAMAFKYGSLVVEMPGQRQLHQNAVDGGIGVQFGDLGEHRGLIHGRFVGDLSECMPTLRQALTLLRT